MENKPVSFTPPCFVINLDRSPERLTEMTQQFSKQAIQFQRISAVDGGTISHTLIDQFYSKSSPLKYHKQLNNGEICCYLSHRKVWQKMVDENIPVAIILEDDVEIVGDLNAVGNTLVAMPKDWDYIKLTEHTRRRKVIYEDDRGPFTRVIYDKIPARTCAQAVSLAGAQKLLAGSNTISRPIDIDLQYWWEKELRIFGLQPYPVRPKADATSEIDKLKQRRTTRKYNWLKVRQQVAFLIKNTKYVRARLASLTNH
ncbi:glycosyltransferase family 25 protein [Alteromonas ponticola]|uniref:Glycosyltransferase family 25 protein n=1 Tax=Alteromonas aquimaris TaxID=2998417 RepID=A0ABT3PB41_9ALTE|nr:glycosyltransferase family 25 protein [Alteromonas aquimaris]MCW8109954.1 glycosyltransferase family 25 protein [Alteromonas aquimaris]